MFAHHIQEFDGVVRRSGDALQIIERLLLLRLSRQARKGRPDLPEGGIVFAPA